MAPLVTAALDRKAAAALCWKAFAAVDEWIEVALAQWEHSQLLLPQAQQARATLLECGARDTSNVGSQETTWNLPIILPRVASTQAAMPVSSLTKGASSTVIVFKTAMLSTHSLTRRRFASAMAAAIPASQLLAASGKRIPVGLEMFSVREELKKDEASTLQQVAKMGYECVEFFAPYTNWTTDHAKEVRKQMDDLNIKCHSTHNSPTSFEGDGLAKAMELNHILGSKYIVMASAGKVTTADGWKAVAEKLDSGNAKMKHAGIHAGYHNHQFEWKPVDGQIPMEILAATDKSVMLQLDVGTCVEAGSDPVAWIEKNPGRIRSLHLKEWSPEQGYKVLFGEGTCPWRKIMAAAESKGGVEFYLIEQEGSRFPEFESADRCLVAFRNLKA